MSLRKKTFIITGITFIVLIAILFIIPSIITKEGFTDIESKEIRKDVERALNVIENEKAVLDDTASDFAAWDETYAFVQNGNKAYVKANLRNSTFSKLKVNYILFVDISGRIIFGKSFDLKHGGETPFPQDLQEQMAANILLTKHANAEKSVTGVILLPDGPMILSSRPILTSEGMGPIRGTLIMGRNLDYFRVKQFAKMTNLSLVMYRIDDEQMPPDMKTINSSLSEDTRVILRPLNEDIIAGYAFVRDIFGKPALVLRVDQPRAIYKEGQSTIHYLLISLFIIAAVFSLVTIMLLEKSVLRRLTRLISDVRQIASVGNFSRRVSPIGRDELSNLAYEINGMLEKLEEAEKFKEETNEARYRAVVEDQTELICRYLPGGTITFVNDACCRYYNIDKSNFLRLNYSCLIPEEYEKFTERIASFSRQNPVTTAEYQVLTGESGVRWQQWTDRAIFDHKGQVIELQSVGRDITDLKQAEGALKHLVELGNLLTIVSTNFINLAAEEIDIGINQALQKIGTLVGADRSKVFLYVDDGEKVCNTHEWCKEGIEPQIKDLQDVSVADVMPWAYERIMKHEILHIPRVADLLPEADSERRIFEARRIRSLIRVPMVSRGSLVGLLGFDSVHTEKRWSEDVITILQIVSSIFVNALERKRTEEALRKSEKGLRQAQKMEAIGTLAGGIAHDFNNILGAIIGLTEMTLYECREASQRRRLEQIIKACGRAKNLVNHILTFSRQSEQERKPVDIGIIVKETLKLLRASLPSTISISSDIKSNSNTVLADPTQLHQIMMNLCTNAAHAMREKGGIMNIGLEGVDIGSMELSSTPGLRSGRYVRLLVSDTGQGIDPAVIDRIYDPFFTTKGPGEGTGLGLSVVYGIVKSYDGAINVYSEPGIGTTFKVYLPSIETSTATETKSIESIPGGKEHILFVDDEEILAEIGREMVQCLGYKVAARTSSIEALEAFRAQPARFDVVITDMTMPNMTGVELAREVHRIRPDIPIIICTGFSELINEAEAKRLGIQKFLMKPLFLKDLALAMRDVLDKKKNTAQA